MDTISDNHHNMFEKNTDYREADVNSLPDFFLYNKRIF
jgi:hypothetical protein